MKFRVGDKVVCTVRPNPKVVAQWPADTKYPSKGETYTIRAINEWERRDTLLRFEELDNRHLEGVYCKIEPGFPARCFVAFFRPASPRDEECEVVILPVMRRHPRECPKVQELRRQSKRLREYFKPKRGG